MMEEWICLKCFRVFSAGKSYAKCCGEIELFDPQKHGKNLVGMSNSWISISEKIDLKWFEHPIYKKIYQEYTDGGSFGASTIFIGFVDELINKLGEQESEPPHIHHFDWERSDGVKKCDCGIIKSE